MRLELECRGVKLLACDASWIDEEISGLASTLEIAALGVSLPLSEIYEDTDVADRAA